MPHKPIPPDAKPLPKDPATGAPLLPDLATGRTYAYTTVQGKAEARVQTEEGMGKGQTHYRISFDCPKCDDRISLDSKDEHGDHPVLCHCSPGYTFLVAW